MNSLTFSSFSRVSISPLLSTFLKNSPPQYLPPSAIEKHLSVLTMGSKLSSKFCPPTAIKYILLSRVPLRVFHNACALSIKLFV